MRSDWALVTDLVIRINGVFGNPNSVPAIGNWTHDSPGHGIKSDAQRTPTGGNHVYADGSGRWVQWSDEWRKLHSWNTTPARELYWFQEDLGELENIASLRP